jgi:MFS family permease
LLERTTLQESFAGAEPSAPEPRPGLFRGWIIVGLAFLVMVLVFGSRFTLGLFIPGLTEDLGVSTASISLVFAISTLLSGLTQPFTGIIADRVGPARVILGGLVLMGLSFFGTGMAVSYWQVMLLMGIATGFAFSAANLVILSALIARWFDRMRGRALGLVTTGSKIGTLIIVPATGLAIVAFDWRAAMIILGLGMLALAPFIWRYMGSDPEEVGLLPDGDIPLPGAAVGRVPKASAADAAPSGSARQAVSTMARNVRALVSIPAFWLISFSLFGNGFMMNLVYLHLPSFLLQRGYGELMATGTLAVMGGIGIVGTIVTGVLSDRMSRKAILAVLYLSRMLATALIILYPGELMIYVFVLIFGFLGFGAVAVTATLTGDVFGRYSLGSVLGLIYVLHQVGGALGMYAGGLSVDLTGSYHVAFWLCAAVSLVSAVLVMTVKAEPTSLGSFAGHLPV